MSPTLYIKLTIVASARDFDQEVILNNSNENNTGVDPKIGVFLFVRSLHNVKGSWKDTSLLLSLNHYFEFMQVLSNDGNIHPFKNQVILPSIYQLGNAFFELEVLSACLERFAKCPPTTLRVHPLFTLGSSCSSSS